MTEAERIAALRDRMSGLGTVKRLRELEFDADELGTGDMIAITERALSLLSQFYVHLATKRTLHATDPEQSLRNLRGELAAIDSGLLPSMDQMEFHRRMVAIFVSLRDRHTSYLLPQPYRRTIAFLPFLVEAIVEGRERLHVISKAVGPLKGGLEAPPDSNGAPAVVTHWNGVPIARAVALNGDRNAGANPAARLARGLDRLTFRWLGNAPPPDEQWVVVNYTVDGKRYQQRFEWLAMQRPDTASAVPAGDRGSSFALGRDLEGEWIRQVKERLFARPEKWERHGSSRRLTYRRHPRDAGRRAYGYLRIYTFDVEPARADAFVSSVRRILRRAPQRGLILDIRGNPGGLISAAERLLPLFSPSAVEVEGLQFLNTSQVATLAENYYRAQGGLGDFEHKLQESRTTGAPYISSPPLAPPDGSPMPDQVYQGPVVLIVDALCYSAAEIFAAGMQDHGLATIVGTAPQTGGGGGNVWQQEQIWRSYGDRRTPSRLPLRASFNVSLRRTTRVRDRAGVALEDLGVVVPPGNVRPLQRADVLGDNDALLDFAIEKLSQQQRHRLRARFDGKGTFKLSTSGIDRVDVYVDGRPLTSENKPNRKVITVADGGPSTALFLGFAGGPEPVTSFRWVAPSH
jgi:C-terminal processing protease CtpA/Prc